MRANHVGDVNDINSHAGPFDLPGHAPRMWMNPDTARVLAATGVKVVIRNRDTWGMRCFVLTGKASGLTRAYHMAMDILNSRLHAPPAPNGPHLALGHAQEQAEEDTFPKSAALSRSTVPKGNAVPTSFYGPTSKATNSNMRWWPLPPPAKAKNMPMTPPPPPPPRRPSATTAGSCTLCGFDKDDANLWLGEERAVYWEKGRLSGYYHAMHDMHHQYLQHLQRKSTDRGSGSGSGSGSSSSDGDESMSSARSCTQNEEEESEEGPPDELDEDEDGTALRSTSEDAKQEEDGADPEYDHFQAAPEPEESPDWGDQLDVLPTSPELFNVQEVPQEGDQERQSEHGLDTTNTAYEDHAIVHEAPAHAFGELPEPEPKKAKILDVLAIHHDNLFQ